MRFHPTRIPQLVFVFFLLSLLILSCSKDSDLLLDALLNQPESIVNEQEKKNDSIVKPVEEEKESPIPSVIFENRIHVFNVLQDAHLQSGKGYNQDIVRLQEDFRTSYLMFDLSPIDSISGIIVNATLKFTINSDDGNGQIIINKAELNEWNEDNLSIETAPKAANKLGEITKEYKVGVTQTIELDPQKLSNEKFTIILNHKQGNDLAFASKEHPSKTGSKLEVEYMVPSGTKEIVIPEIDTTPSPDNQNNPNENSAPISVADATPTSGGFPLEVDFTGGNSSDDKQIDKYHWEFIDGETSNEPNPTYTFDQVGTYDVVLTTTDSDGLTSTDTVTIVVTEKNNEAPVAKVTANPTLGVAPLEVQFIGNTSTDDHSVASYYYDFKDGSTTSNSNPSHSFTEPGTYEVLFTVKDENGLEDSKNITITVAAPEQNEAPKAVATASQTSGEAPLEIQFLGQNSTDDNEIVSYLWDFKDGSTTSNINPSHTFSNAGVYDVALTVTDVKGLKDTETITVTITTETNNTPTPNVPNGFYVTPTGNSSNNGLSETNAWSLEYAFQRAGPGDIIYIKSGIYSNPELITYRSGNFSSPIKFIGYKNTPGDITVNQNYSFNYGDQLDPNKMPLIKGGSFNSGTGISIQNSFIEISNIQITNFLTGINSSQSNVKLRNIIVTNLGEQNHNGSQGGRAIQIYGNNSSIEDCFILNANAEGINIKGGNSCVVRRTKVYSDNKSNPGGYYIAITFGGSNNIIEDCLIYRDKNADLHRGHGFIMKDKASNNIVRRSKAYNTGIEVNFSGVHDNTFDDVQIYGSASQDSGEFSSGIRVLNGAHNNTFKNIYIENSLYPFNFHDFDDGFANPDGDRDETQGGNYNKFINIVSDRSNSVILCNTKDTPVGQSTSTGNSWENCTFSNVSSIPFYSNHITSGFSFSNCTFKNIEGDQLSQTQNGLGSWNASYINCVFTNVDFQIPN